MKRSKQYEPPAALYIGVNKEAVNTAATAIISIIKAGGTEAVAIEGLRCLSALCPGGPVSVSNCTFNYGGGHE